MAHHLRSGTRGAAVRSMSRPDPTLEQPTKPDRVPKKSAFHARFLPHGTPASESCQPLLASQRPADEGAPEMAGLWLVGEKLNHVRRLLAAGTAEAGVTSLAGRVFFAVDRVAVAALSCGTVLLAWSYAAVRPDLRSPGFASVVLGAAGGLAAWCFAASATLPLRSARRIP